MGASSVVAMVVSMVGLLEKRMVDPKVVMRVVE